MNLTTRSIMKTMLCFALFLFAASAYSANGKANRRQGATSGAVYVSTNQPGDNEVYAYHHSANGKLVLQQRIATGGSGSRTTTESQDAVVLNADHTLLFVVNVASNDISVFRVNSKTFGLTFVQRISSGGNRPVALAVRNDLLYVVNSGENNGINGFRIGDNGKLTPIEGSAQPLSFGDKSPFNPDVTVPCPTIFSAFRSGVICSVAQPADIRFSPDGRFLIVSERLTNQFSVYDVDENGVAGERHSRTSSGESPFGIDFDNKGHMIVAESFLDSPGTPGSNNPKTGNGAASSYNLTDQGATRIITYSLRTGRRTGCWMAITPNGRYAYMSNPGGASISSFRILGNGKLRLLQSVAAPSNDPRDEDITPNGRYLYVLNNQAGSVNGYRINKDGSLDQVTTTGRVLPLFSLGLAAF